jgi:hypothetical protein
MESSAEQITRLEEFIREISEELKGHLPNIERSFLVADRKDARQKLASLKEQQ